MSPVPLKLLLLPTLAPPPDVLLVNLLPLLVDIDVNIGPKLLDVVLCSSSGDEGLECVVENDDEIEGDPTEPK